MAPHQIAMKCTWMQKELRELSRWQYRKRVKYMRQLELQRLNWGMYADNVTDDQLGLTQVKSLGTPTEFDVLHASMLDLRLGFLADEICQLRYLVALDNTEVVPATGMSADPDASSPCMTQGFGQLVSLLDKWTKTVSKDADELREVLMSVWSRGRSSLIQDYYIGSSEDDSDEHGDRERGLDFEDLVCLECDFETHDDRLIQQGTVGTVRAVHRYDELPLVEVQFPGELRCHAISEIDLRLVEKAERPAGLQIIPDGHRGERRDFGFRPG